MATVTEDFSENIEQDFSRDVWCLFGLPVDNIDMQQTINILRERKTQNGKMVLSTINVNWVVQSFRDTKFRQAIINSDLITLDGKPLVWLAHLLHFPMKDVVAGSSLMQELNKNTELQDSPFSLFLFGGEEGVGQLAKERINRKKGGLHAVGTLNPGFGSVKEISTGEIIRSINQTSPDILLVALGAIKGTDWIELNRSRLNAKVISHLGATINFLAGTVQRAPAWFRKLGMEWIWRIYQEPKLSVRYLNDGLFLLEHIVGNYLLWYHAATRQGIFQHSSDKMEIKQEKNNDNIIIFFAGHLEAQSESSLREIFCDAIKSKRNIILDFARTSSTEGSFLGQLLLLMKWQHRNNRTISLQNVPENIHKLFHFFAIDHSLNATDCNDTSNSPNFS